MLRRDVAEKGHSRIARTSLKESTGHYNVPVRRTCDILDMKMCYVGYAINMRDVAKDIVQKNLYIDFKYVLGQENIFDVLFLKYLNVFKKFMLEKTNKKKKTIIFGN